MCVIKIKQTDKITAMKLNARLNMIKTWNKMQKKDSKWNAQDKHVFKKFSNCFDN